MGGTRRFSKRAVVKCQLQICLCQGPQELARGLRMAAIQLLMNIIDMEAVHSLMLMLWCLSHSYCAA